MSFQSFLPEPRSSSPAFDYPPTPSTRARQQAVADLRRHELRVQQYFDSRRRRTTQDEQAIMVLMSNSGMSYRDIATVFGRPYDTIYSIFRRQRLARSRPPRVRFNRAFQGLQIEQIRLFLEQDWKHRRMTFRELIQHLNLDCCERTLREFMKFHGHRRYVAKKTTRTSEITRRKRVRFAQEYLHWTVEDWSKILWTDETWVSGGSHSRVFVTRTKDEGLEKDCIDPQV
jgi:ketohexokinase/beta-glucosidase